MTLVLLVTHFPMTDTLNLYWTLNLTLFETNWPTTYYIDAKKIISQPNPASLELLENFISQNLKVLISLENLCLDWSNEVAIYMYIHA